MADHLAGIGLLVRGRHELYVSSLAALLESHGAAIRVSAPEAELPRRLPAGVQIVLLESPLPSDLRAAAALGAPIVVLAERAHPEDRLAAAQLGAQALLAKNATLAELMVSIRHALENREGEPRHPSRNALRLDPAPARGAEPDRRRAGQQGDRRPPRDLGANRTCPRVGRPSSPRRGQPHPGRGRGRPEGNSRLAGAAGRARVARSARGALIGCRRYGHREPRLSARTRGRRSLRGLGLRHDDRPAARCLALGSAAHARFGREAPDFLDGARSRGSGGAVPDHGRHHGHDRGRHPDRRRLPARPRRPLARLRGPRRACPRDQGPRSERDQRAGVRGRELLRRPPRRSRERIRDLAYGSDPSPPSPSTKASRGRTPAASRRIRHGSSQRASRPSSRPSA